MRIAFAIPAPVPGFSRSGRWPSRAMGRGLRPPDQLLTAAAWLEREGHETRCFDLTARPLLPEELARHFRDFAPELLVLPSTAATREGDLAFAADRRREAPGLTVAFVGPLASAAPSSLLPDPACGAVRGEYEEPLAALARGRLWTGIPGLVWRETAGDVRENPRGPWLDVSRLPFPAWRHIDPNDYPDGIKRFPCLPLSTGRGCPYRCTFCAEPQLLFGRGFRPRPAQAVADEIADDLRRFPGLAEIMFETDSFTSFPEHVRGICEELARRDFRISWGCNSRVDMDPALLPVMKEAGCRLLVVGFESGSDRTLATLQKDATVAQGLALARAARGHGLLVHGCFVWGAPGETLEDCEETLRFSRALPITSFQFTPLSPAPGTEGFAGPGDQGALDARLRLRPPSPFPENGIRRAYLGFYLRPVIWWRTLAPLRSLADLKSRWYGLAGFAKELLGG